MCLTFPAPDLHASHICLEWTVAFLHSDSVLSIYSWTFPRISLTLFHPHSIQQTTRDFGRPQMQGDDPHCRHLCPPIGASSSTMCCFFGESGIKESGTFSGFSICPVLWQEVTKGLLSFVACAFNWLLQLVRCRLRCVERWLLECLCTLALPFFTYLLHAKAFSLCPLLSLPGPRVQLSQG